MATRTVSTAFAGMYVTCTGPPDLDQSLTMMALASMLCLGSLAALLKLRQESEEEDESPLHSTGQLLGWSLKHTPFPLLLLCLFFSGFATMGVLTISLTVPTEHERLSASAGGVSGLISSVRNIGPLLMPIIFGLLIDVTETFQASVLCVAVMAGATFILGSRVRE